MTLLYNNLLPCFVGNARVTRALRVATCEGQRAGYIRAAVQLPAAVS